MYIKLVLSLFRDFLHLQESDMDVDPKTVVQVFLTSYFHCICSVGLCFSNSFFSWLLKSSSTLSSSQLSSQIVKSSASGFPWISVYQEKIVRQKSLSITNDTNLLQETPRIRRPLPRDRDLLSRPSFPPCLSWHLSCLEKA